ncbi:hypothetical protein N3K63_06920 [Microbacterium sp. W1N]|uniref:hypothetical protein n=1 Tax=Microbacterium festucae TaxID=2977531 RepID=UPI0021C20A23|nr:hypothetical protein [Microbacterium festucae]MCT9820021.1 hypothetical protein [Microbacterium festucae]
MTRSAAHRVVLAATGALLLIGSAGCASGPAAREPGAAPGLTTATPGLPEGEVTAQGTVLDDGDGAQLCLGPVAESFPPQCQGLPLAAWEWDGLDGSETAAGVTWGSYAVQGTYDGETFTITQPPVMLALYDPMVPDDPTGGEPGPADEATLLRVQEEVHADLGAAALSSWPQNGRLWVQVVWDDGILQDAADGAYGDDVVVIQSALREVS